MGLPNQAQNAQPMYIVEGDPSSSNFGKPVTAANNGLGYEDQRVLDGFGYTVSTAIVSVAVGNFLIAELSNPSNSGVNLIMTSRVFSNNVIGGTAPLEYVRWAPTAIFPTGTATTATVGNRVSGGAPSPATFKFMMGGSQPTGTATSSGFIPTNGEEKRIKDIVIIPPGGKLLYSVGGGSMGGLTNAARIAITFLFYTRPA